MYVWREREWDKGRVIEEGGGKRIHTKTRSKWRERREKRTDGREGCLFTYKIGLPLLYHGVFLNHLHSILQFYNRVPS
jgi:hypothetical protein